MPAHRPLLAISLRLVAAALLGTVLALVKYAAEHGTSLVEIMFWRQAVAIPIIVGYLVSTGQLALLRTQRLPVHFRRAAMGTLVMALNFLTSILLPLAVATTLGFTTPLFAVIVAAVFFSERIGPWRWSAVLLGFIGVVLIARPGQGDMTDVSLAGAALGLTNALLIAGINFQIRDLARTENTSAMVFYFSAFATPFLLALLPFFATTHDLEGWLILVAIGLFGMGVQYFASASLHFAAVSTVIAMDYSQIIWATLYGWLVWNHLPTASMLLGAPLIVAAGLLIAWREHRHHREPSPSGPAILD